MNKKLLVAVVVVLVIASFTLGYFLSPNSNRKPEEVNTNTTNVEVYEEYTKQQINKVIITGVNTNLQIGPSENANIKLIYQPHELNERNYDLKIENGVLSLDVHKIDITGQMIPDESEIVYLFLPYNSSIIVENTSESGFCDIHDVTLESVSLNSGAGIINMSNVNVTNSIHMESVSGKVIIKNVVFSSLNVKTSTALISCVLEDSKNDYYTQIMAPQVYVDGKKLVESNLVEGKENMKGVSLISKTGIVRIKYQGIKNEESN